MTVADFYLGCFLFGFFFSVITVLFGQLQVDVGDGGTGDAGGMEDGGAINGDSHHVSPFNMGTGAAFLAWFGGTGYLTTRFYSLWFATTLMLAIAAGLAGAWLVYLFLTKVLMRSREELNPADFEMVGVLGSVTSLIRSGGIGEILFTQDGSRKAAAARSEDGSEITTGEDVVVTRYENGIAWVRRWTDLIG